MSRQSDFGRLFRKHVFGDQEPIENYTSEALAIAIEHDDRPMRRALAGIVWPTSSPFRATDVARIVPKTQHFLPALDGPDERVRCGYLDLVLELTFTDGGTATAWVEVKVDTGEHGGQLDIYAKHARRQPHPPCVFTLSKAEVRRFAQHPKDLAIGWLSWEVLARAVEQSVGADRRWDDLLTFLNEEGIAWRSLPADRVDPEAHLKVLMEVNRQIAARWPSGEMNFVRSGALRTLALNHFKASSRLVATGGPLTYGLVPDNGGWFWTITVGSTNWQSVPLDPTQMICEADQAGLSNRWQRTEIRSRTLALEVPLQEFSSYESATGWFSAALNELDEKGILNRFLRGLETKRRAATTRDQP